MLRFDSIRIIQFSLYCVFIVCPLVGVAGDANSNPGKYTEAMFRHAIENEARHDYPASPEFVLITVADQKTGAERVVCLLGGFVLQAIERELLASATYGANIDPVKFALAQVDRKFSFRDPRSLQDVKPNYDEATLQRVRALLSSKSNDELRRKFRDRRQTARLTCFAVGTLWPTFSWSAASA